MQTMETYLFHITVMDAVIDRVIITIIIMGVTITVIIMGATITMIAMGATITLIVMGDTKEADVPRTMTAFAGPPDMSLRDVLGILQTSIQYESIRHFVL